MDKVGHVVVEIGECNSILRPDQLTDDIFVDIIELVPIFILCVGILDQRLEFGSTRNRHVKRLGGEERFEVEEVKIIVIDEICVSLVDNDDENAPYRSCSKYSEETKQKMKKKRNQVTCPRLGILEESPCPLTAMEGEVP